MIIGLALKGSIMLTLFGVRGQQTCLVTCPMMNEMLGVSVGSRKALDFPLPGLTFYPCDF